MSDPMDRPTAPQLDTLLRDTTILVVDDLAAARRALGRMLQRAGAQVIEAADGDQALALLEQQTPDLMLLDIDMPGLNGFDVCRFIRHGVAQPRLPIVLVTGRDDEDRHLAGFAAGCDDFLAKPIVPAVLVVRVASLIAKRTTERENCRLLSIMSRYVTEPARDGQQDHAVVQVKGTILFSDLRGFTTMSEAVDPAVLFRTLNQVQIAQTEQVKRSGGYVDKFSGDGMLAVFTGESHVDHACRAASGIVAWAKEFAGPSFWQPLPIGIGLDTGVFLRGDMGGEDYRELTVIGPTVNTASRLCGLANALEVLTTTEVRKSAGNCQQFCSPQQVRIKGLADERTVWRLTA